MKLGRRETVAALFDATGFEDDLSVDLFDEFRCVGHDNQRRFGKVAENSFED